MRFMNKQLKINPFHAGLPKTQGFTLIEVMISMMIFGIAIVSVIAIQNSSLQSHINDEDTIIANGLADQLLEMIQTDAILWIAPNETSLTHFLNNSINRRMSTLSNPVWIPYTTQPVNHQLGDVSQSSHVGSKARFCIFYLYRWAGEDSAKTPLTNDLIELNVVVMWARKIGGLSGANAAFFNTCGTSSGSPNTSVLFTYLEDPTKANLVNKEFRQVRRVTYVRRDQIGKGT